MRALLHIVFLLPFFLASPSVWGATNGALDLGACEHTDAKSTALALYSWIDNAGGTSDRIYRAQAEIIFSPTMYARFVEAPSDFGSFFTPVSGQDFYLSKDVPIAIEKIEFADPTRTRLKMVVTFRVNVGPPVSRAIILMMSYYDEKCKIDNIHNSKRWMLRRPR